MLNANDAAALANFFSCHTDHTAEMEEELELFLLDVCEPAIIRAAKELNDFAIVIVPEKLNPDDVAKHLRQFDYQATVIWGRCGYANCVIIRWE